jgi:MarR-like DNA-binding transcriptional regulator SgrR of sgrS sRNA
MPTSANIVFDVLRNMTGNEAIELSICDLAHLCRLSETQVRRALRRLQGARLIRWTNFGPGRGRRSIFEVLWKSFPQKKGPSPNTFT